MIFHVSLWKFLSGPRWSVSYMHGVAILCWITGAEDGTYSSVMWRVATTSDLEPTRVPWPHATHGDSLFPQEWTLTFCSIISSVNCTRTCCNEPRLHYTVSQKNSQNYFRQNFVKFPLTLIIFDTKMAKTIELCKVHSLSTSPSLCQCTTA